MDSNYRKKNLLLLKWLKQLETMIEEMNGCKYKFDEFFTNNLMVDICLELEPIVEEINSVIDSSEVEKATIKLYSSKLEEFEKRIKQLEDQTGE